jgi:hypothetical protein
MKVIALEMLLGKRSRLYCSFKKIEKQIKSQILKIYSWIMTEHLMKH